MSRYPLIFLSAEVLANHLISGRERPFLASYKLTYRCNLHCQQCPFAGQPGADPSFEQVLSVLDQLRQRGDRVVVFEGGEPLLWKDAAVKTEVKTFNDVVREARQRFACVAVTTNGTLPLDVDTDVLWVSVDGFAETHNRLRGAPIFDQVIANIRASHHPRLYAHITVNAENAAETPTLAHFLSGLVKGITVQFYYPYGAGDRLFLPWPERRALLRKLIELKREGVPILNSAVSLQALRKPGGWRCLPHRIDCANPDGAVWQGCYLQGRAAVDCAKCGFSPYTEMSLAFQGHPAAILAGMRIFF